jgi:hypothetical protein
VIVNKKVTGLSEMKKCIEWIERFNSDYCRNYSSSGAVIPPKLTAQICGPQNFSLLHAAIIFESHENVEKLLSLGADPMSKSEHGSALSYAMNLKVS